MFIVLYYVFMKLVKYILDKLIYSDLIFEKPCNEYIIPKAVTRTYDKVASGIDNLSSKIGSLF